MNRNCSVSSMKVDENNYLKKRTVCKSCYNKNRRKNNNNTLIQSQQLRSDNKHDNDKKKRKVVDSMNKNKNRTLIFIGFSNCGKTYLVNYILHQKQEPIFLITKSLNQNPKIRAQISDQIEPLENYETSTVVFGDMLLSKQESNFDMFFTRGCHKHIGIYYISHSYFHFPKNTIRNNSNEIILLRQTLRDITLLFHDIAGSDMTSEEWKELCRKASETEYVYLLIDRFAKIGNSRYTIKNCIKNTYIEGTPETKNLSNFYI